MNPDSPCFDSFRLRAAREFAQTMVVIDDEASQAPEREEPVTEGVLRKPTRESRAANVDTSSKNAATEGPDSHPLDAKALIEAAMELGVICSVLRPAKNDGFEERVLKAIEAADIVCLDWDIFGDGGEAASGIIRRTIERDNELSGRLRLIAVYTGDKTSPILKRIFESIPEDIRNDHGYTSRTGEITSGSGVRIAVLYKAQGIQMPETGGGGDQVSEAELPERLQREFSKLSEGLLSNVALAAVGALRRSTHHVLARFGHRLDGPYFHHRATIPTPEDAEEYAVNVVLSELKGAMGIQRVAEEYAGKEAINSRLREFADEEGCLMSDNEAAHNIEWESVAKLVSNGVKKAFQTVTVPQGLTQKQLTKNFTTLFVRNGKRKAARDAMHEFAALTGVRADPSSPPYRSHELKPRLGLGTIVRKEGTETFLICLQASCDCARIADREKFLFVPLDQMQNANEGFDGVHVVPAPKGSQDAYIALRIAKRMYREARLIEFKGCERTQTINASANGGGDHYFVSTCEERFLWIADLKRRRALRAAQELGQAIGRLGFDEFEPYRKREKT